MNVNFRADDQAAEESGRAAKEPGAAEAGASSWPSLILEWQGVPDMPPFESYRGELLPPASRPSRAKGRTRAQA